MWSNIQSTVEYILFSTSLKTMTKSQKKKKNLSKRQRTEIIQLVLSDHNGISQI